MDDFGYWIRLSKEAGGVFHLVSCWNSESTDGKYRRVDIHSSCSTKVERGTGDVIDKCEKRLGEVE